MFESKNAIFLISQLSNHYQREMAVDVYYNVYIYTAQVRPFG